MIHLNQQIINNLQLDLLVNKGCNNICLWILGRTKKTEIEFTLAEIALSPTCAKDSWQAVAIYSLTFPFTQRTFPKPIWTWQLYIWSLVMLFLRSQYIRRTKLKRKGSQKKADHQANLRRTFDVTEIWRRLLEKAKQGRPGFQVTDSQRDQNKYLLPRLDSWEPWRHFLSHCLVPGKKLLLFDLNRAERFAQVCSRGHERYERDPVDFNAPRGFRC